MSVTYSDYLNSSSSVRDRRSRIIQLRIKIDSLPLDEHARDKFIRLVGDRSVILVENISANNISLKIFEIIIFLTNFIHRYNEETGEVLLVADRCPYRGQNEDYCKYLLTALLHESWRVEDWELKQVEDREYFESEQEVGDKGREALQMLLNQGENDVTVSQYREEVRKLLGLPETIVRAESV